MFKEIDPLVFPNKGTELLVNKNIIAHHVQINQYKMKLMSESTPFIRLCSQYNSVMR